MVGLFTLRRFVKRQIVRFFYFEKSELRRTPSLRASSFHGKKDLSSGHQRVIYKYRALVLYRALKCLLCSAQFRAGCLRISMF